MTNIKVSIVSISYNQEKYIEQALESFISQKTNFEFEIIIGDDASTDETQNLIREYEKKYPNIIKSVLRDKNIGVQKNLIDVLNRAEGDYIALCEGDDFWSDVTKLQKQADFLDSHKKYNIVFHPVSVLMDGNDGNTDIYPKEGNASYFTLENLLKTNFIQTNSVMYRKINYNNLSYSVMPFDWYLHLLHAQNGNVGFINKPMAVYRKHQAGIWWEATHDTQDKIWKQHGAGHLVLYAELLKMYGETSAYQKIIDNHIEGTITILDRIDSEAKTHLVEDFTQKFPELSTPLFLSLARTTYRNYRQAEKQADIHKKELRGLVETIDGLQREKQDILNSKTYKVGHKLAQVSRFVRRKV